MCAREARRGREDRGPGFDRGGRLSHCHEERGHSEGAQGEASEPFPIRQMGERWGWLHRKEVQEDADRGANGPGEVHSGEAGGNTSFERKKRQQGRALDRGGIQSFQIHVVPCELGRTSDATWSCRDGLHPIQQITQRSHPRCGGPQQDDWASTQHLGPGVALQEVQAGRDDVHRSQWCWRSGRGGPISRRERAPGGSGTGSVDGSGIELAPGTRPEDSNQCPLMEKFQAQTEGDEHNGERNYVAISVPGRGGVATGVLPGPGLQRRQGLRLEAQHCAICRDAPGRVRADVPAGAVSDHRREVALWRAVQAMSFLETGQEDRLGIGGHHRPHDQDRVPGPLDPPSSNARGRHDQGRHYEGQWSSVAHAQTWASAHRQGGERAHSTPQRSYGKISHQAV